MRVSHRSGCRNGPRPGGPPEGHDGREISVHRGASRSAALAYLIGTIGVTVFGDVPFNNRLASIDPQAESSVAIWQDYLHHWTRWNHLRTPAALLVAVGFLAISK